jgi:hypothetical protein
MKIALRPFLWVVVLLAIYMAFKAPATLSTVLNDIGRVIGSVASGVTSALHTATAGKSS